MTTAFSNAVADLISDARENKIPLKEVCERAGVGRATLYRYEATVPEPVENIERLRLAVRQAKRARGKDVADD